MNSKSKSKSYVRTALSLLMVYTSLACGDSDSSSPPPPPEETPTGVVSSGVLSSNQGKSGPFIPTVLPAASVSVSKLPPTSPLGDANSAQLAGLPASPSRDTNLEIKIQGEKAKKYRMALLSGAGGCNNVNYGESVDAAAPITLTLTSDQTYTLCVAVDVADTEETFKVVPFSHTWLRDTSVPALGATLSLVYGPAGQSSQVSFPITATDSGSGLAEVRYSVSSPSGCLSEDQSNFNAPCPQYRTAAATGGGGFLGIIPTSLLSSGVQYSVWLQGRDVAGNVSEQSSPSWVFTWDSLAPSPSANLTASAGQEEVNLSWTAVGDASQYLVVRRSSASVSQGPIVGGAYEVGTHLGNQNFIACKTSSTNCVDQGQVAFQWQYYKVYVVDQAGNVSLASPEASAQPTEKPKFQGLTNAYVRGFGRQIITEWQKFAPSGLSFSDISYQLFDSLTPSGQNFSSSLASVSQNDRLMVDYGSSPANLYLIGRASGSGYSSDQNSRELRLKLGQGYHHKISSTGRFNGQEPQLQTFLRNGWAVAKDPYGNIIFSGASGTINAMCLETTSAYYCKGRDQGRLYSIVGSDGLGDGPDGELASASKIGDAYGLDFDPSGNLYIADSSFMRIRVVCYNPAAVGACNGKTVGFIYHMAGSGGSSIDGLDDIIAKNSGIGIPYGVAVDSLGNVTLADSTFRRLRIICMSTQASAQNPFCQGKVTGNIYYLAGSGVSADGAHQSSQFTAAFGAPSELVRDAQGNLFFSDTTFFRIRALCLVVTGTNHYCAGKTAGMVYQFAGTGASADGADNSVLASHGIGQVFGLALNPDGNLLATDSTYFRIRIFCIVDTGSFCTSNIGKGYRIAGINTVADGADNALSLTVPIGTPRGIKTDSTGNFFAYDSSNRRIRLFCLNSSSQGLCNGRLADYHYRWIGSGTVSLGWNLDAFLTPMGIPQALARDNAGNLYFADSVNFVVRAICYNTTAAGYCSGKVSGTSYIVTGTGANGNGTDATLAVASAIGTVTGIKLDQNNNILLGDNTNRTVRLVCVNTTGKCSGRLQGYSYRYIGNTTQGDTTNVAMSGAVLGLVGDIGLDSFGNVWVADQQYFRLKVACTTTSGYCSGRTNGNIYHVSGTGVTGNGANNGVGTSTAMGAPFALDIDPWDNAILADSTNFRMRIHCVNTAGGFCTGRTAGNVYHLAGTGVTGDGADNVAANSGAVGIITGIATDSNGNVYMADSTARRIRVYCQVTTPGICSGKSAGNTYRIYGTGVNNDGSSGYAGMFTPIETPSRGALLLVLSSNDLYYAGGTALANLGSIRLFLGN